MTLLELADALMEVRRYVRSNPEHVIEEITKPAFSTQCVRECSAGFRHRIRELQRNIYIALDYIHTEPEFLRAYLYAAAFEIRCEAMRMGQDA